MSCRQRLLLLVVIGLVGLSSAALAGKPEVLNAVKIDQDPVSSQTLGGAAATACYLGNTNDPAYYINGWLTGDEAYKFLFHPRLTNQCGCPYGFRITTVHFFLYFPDIRARVPIWVDLENALWDPVLQCWVPGPEDCVSPTYTVQVPSTGLYDIALPLPCDCAFMDYWYLISVHLGTITGTTNLPKIVVDAGPVLPCYNWNDWGEGWVDLSTVGGWVWNVAMYAEAECCENPVPEEGTSWGQVKQLYR